MYYNLRRPYPNEIIHSGIKGQKWGVRRFQNKDGSLTQAGKLRYQSKEYREELEYNSRKKIYMDHRPRRTKIQKENRRR